MSDAPVTRLSDTNWIRALISSPHWTPISAASRVPKASSEDSFFAETLKTDRTIRECVILRPKKANNDEYMLYPEVKTIVELGDGLNGFPKIAHGGFVATLLDEVMGALITTNIEARIDKKKRLGLDGSNEIMGCFTAYLNTSYKKPVPTPSVVLCTATFDRRERNKIYLRATIEDGLGTVYTTGEGMFVEPKSQL